MHKTHIFAHFSGASVREGSTEFTELHLVLAPIWHHFRTIGTPWGAQFMAKGRAGIAREAPMSAVAVNRLKKTAFVGGAPGLELRISAGGTRAWRLYYRLPGDLRRRVMSLGRFPAVTLGDARRRANEALALAADGSDPKAIRVARAARSTVTVDGALDEYLEHSARDNDPKTTADKKSAFKTHVRPKFGESALISTRRTDWIGLVDALGDQPGSRRNLYVYLSHFLSWAVERDMIDANPLIGIRAPKPVAARDRVLTDDEIRRLWIVKTDTGDLARLALLTAQRKGSLAAMRWDQIDAGRQHWVVPASDMKSGTLHEVPLSAKALAIIENRPRLAGPFVFGIGSAGERPFNGFSNGMGILRRSLEAVQPDQGKSRKPARRGAATEKESSPTTALWRFHDLRRTAVTLAQRGGAPLDAVRALTQHKTPGVIGVYARHAYAQEKREVVLRIEDVVTDICSSSLGRTGRT